MRPSKTPTISIHVYEIRPRAHKRGVHLISDALPFGKLWYLEVSDAIGYAKHCSRSHHAVIRVFDAAGYVIERTSTRASSRSREFGLHHVTLLAKGIFMKPTAPLQGEFGVFAVALCRGLSLSR
jgi:hypothetical protein